MNLSEAMRNRVREAVGEISSTSVVVFDEDAGRSVRFRIDTPTGRILTVAHPHFDPSEVEDWADDKLNRVIRILAPTL